jgi:transcription initiation factor TFIIA large subunit
MSNKIVPTIYRAVIDDVILAIKSEFDEYGVAEDVLAELQHKWESKVMASRVAEFEAQSHPAAPPTTHPAAVSAAPHHAYSHAMHMHPHYTVHNAYAAVAASAPSNQPNIKSEPIDTRFMANASLPYTLPPLPGPAMNGSRQLPPLGPTNPGGQTGVFSFKAAPPPVARAYAPAPAAQRIPQVDGPSESSGEEESPSPPPSGAFAPRASHPSLPQPIVPKQSTNDPEAINSDLDDSDTEGEDETEEVASHDTDIVFCTYDKVARVKNKWKCTLKDGMIHINGKDYLFAKCNGEFEW